jgi:rhodanese-related sulfurtransferase
MLDARSVPPEEAWRRLQGGDPMFDLRTRAERIIFGWPPGSIKVSLLWHRLRPDATAIYLCQHAVRSKGPARRGAAEVAGGFVAWEQLGLPITGGRFKR